MAEITPAHLAFGIREGMRIDSRAGGPLLPVTPGRAPYALGIPAKEGR